MPICSFCLKWYKYPIYYLASSSQPSWSTPRCPHCHEDQNFKKIEDEICKPIDEVDRLILLLEECLKILNDIKLKKGELGH